MVTLCAAMHITKTTYQRQHKISEKVRWWTFRQRCWYMAVGLCVAANLKFFVSQLPGFLSISWLHCFHGTFLSAAGHDNTQHTRSYGYWSSASFFIDSVREEQFVLTRAFTFLINNHNIYLLKISLFIGSFTSIWNCHSPTSTKYEVGVTT